MDRFVLKDSPEGEIDLRAIVLPAADLDRAAVGDLRKAAVEKSEEIIQSIWYKGGLQDSSIRKKLATLIPGSDPEVRSKHAKQHFTSRAKKSCLQLAPQAVGDLILSLEQINQSIKEESLSGPKHRIRPSKPFKATKPLTAEAEEIKTTIELIFPTKRYNKIYQNQDLLDEIFNLFPGVNREIANKNIKKHLISLLMRVNEDENHQLLSSILAGMRSIRTSIFEVSTRWVDFWLKLEL